MIIPTKKLNNGFEMPVYGIGTSGMAGKILHNPFKEYTQDVEAITAAIELGVTHIDTAEVYAQGNAEKLVSKAIKNYDRSRLFLVSKAHLSNLNFKGIKKALRGSLKRMGTNYLDLYLMHRYPGDSKLEECVRAIDELIDEGQIKNFGVSNFNLQHTKDTASISKHPLAATQVHYNLIFREPETTGLLEYCQQNNVMLIAWRPVEKGLLAKLGISMLDEISEQYKKSPAQIAINWLISQTNVVTISKTSSHRHLEENLGAIGWQMENADVERLRKSFPNQQKVSDRIPLE